MERRSFLKAVGAVVATVSTPGLASSLLSSSPPPSPWMNWSPSAAVGVVRGDIFIKLYDIAGNLLCRLPVKSTEIIDGRAHLSCESGMMMQVGDEVVIEAEDGTVLARTPCSWNTRTISTGDVCNIVLSP